MFVMNRLLFFSLIMGAANIAPLSSAFAAEKPICTAQQMNELRSPASAENPSFDLRCHASLLPSDVITKAIMFSGAEASDLSLNCHGARLTGNSHSSDTIKIRSVETSPLQWSVPSNVTLRDCHIEGSARIWGMSTTGEGARLRQSSIRLGHTERAQSAAPRFVTFENVAILGRGRIPLYLSPGVTHFTMRGGAMTGHSQSVAVYLDAESARNTFDGVRFDVTSNREQMAIDGSAHNTVINNQFLRTARGGVYLYRNCGLQGTVRHQTPSFNRITGNTFAKPQWWDWRVSRDNLAMNFSLGSPMIWENSRQWKNWFCDDDKGYPFGSSADDASGARGNILQN
jgi:hypothetical protein